MLLLNGYLAVAWQECYHPAVRGAMAVYRHFLRNCRIMEFLREMDEPFCRLAESVSFDYLWGVSLSGRTHIDQRDWECWPQTLVGQLRGGTVDIEFADGRRVTIRSGSAYCIPCGSAHRYVITGGAHFAFCNAHVRYRFLEGPDILRRIPVPVCIRGTAAQAIGAACRRLLSAHQSAGSILGRLAARQNGAAALLAVFADLSDADATLRAWLSDTGRLRPVLCRIHADFAQPLRRGELARMLHLSEAHFHEIFQASMGAAPMEYVKHVRLEHARHLLSVTDDPVGHIGAQCGYPDPFHFTHVFTEASGQSPRAYRNSVRAALRMYEESRGICRRR